MDFELEMKILNPPYSKFHPSDNYKCTLPGAQMKGFTDSTHKSI